MSQQPKEKKKRLSLPAAMPMAQPMLQPGMGQQQAAHQMWLAPPMWNPMWMQQTPAAGPQQAPMLMPGPGMPSTSSGATRKRSRNRELTGDSSDSLDSSDDDFAPHKRQKQTPKKSTSAHKTDQKRGPGRPPKKETLAREKALRDERILSNYPCAFLGSDTISYLQVNECRKCQVFVGQIILMPCGHARYCKTCINSMREESIKMKRPAKCLADDCFEFVESWMLLKHVWD